jgi:hypothetical protein
MTPFTQILGRLLDNGEWTRAEWATILNVSEETIQSWFHDEHWPTPSPENLRRIIHTLEEDPNVPDSLLEDFDRVANMPLHESMPYPPGSWLTAGWPDTLAESMTQPIREAFLHTLATVPVHAQENVLFAAAEVARAHRNVTYRTPRSPNVERSSVKSSPRHPSTVVLGWTKL